ncbi:MAG: ATP-binding protein [Prevotella sp.]|nr:ATP-binding protein [Prevotella sp.]CDE08768.1 aTPase/histidine kinase/DNA gyrase B/HSP90 domain protein [Prevotella sp. CAG:485]
MDMLSCFRLTYHKRLFLGLLFYSWLLVGSLALFQYQREKKFKAEELNSRLQVVNDLILSRLDSTGRLTVPPVDIHGLRISVIDKQGKVIYDNSLDALPGTSHLNREEIAEALATGEGYTLRRHSDTNGKTYFYSATRGDKYVVRTAIPYSMNLNHVLAADGAFLWFMLAVTAVMSIMGYFATRRMGSDIEKEESRIKRQITNNLNHELKTPAASMQVCLETLLEHPDLDAERRNNFIKRCYDANQRLQSLLADVSALTRIEDGGKQIDRQKINAGGVVAEVCKEYEEVARGKNFTINNKVPDELWIQGNASLLASVFRNLINNALAYSEGSKITISLLRRTPTEYIFSFADNGKGVPQRHINKIFERFYRVDKGRSRQSGGTGLGLAIVKNAVQWHGGTIKAENLPLGGLRFIFSLRK